MMIKLRQTSAIPLRMTGLCLALLLLSGCVYLRLLKVKNQLAEFDKNFTVENGDSFILHCNNPVMYSRDIIYLTEIEPSQRETNGERETFRYRFVRHSENQAADSPDLEFELRFNKDKRLDALMFSPVILQLVPADFLEISLRSLGFADVDRRKRQVRADTSKISRDGLDPPLMQTIQTQLGPPNQTETSEEGLVLLYEYRLDTPSQGKKAENRKKALIHLLFDPGTHLLKELSGNFAGMKITIHYDKLMKENHPGEHD